MSTARSRSTAARRSFRSSLYSSGRTRRTASADRSGSCDGIAAETAMGLGTMKSTPAKRINDPDHLDVGEPRRILALRTQTRARSGQPWPTRADDPRRAGALAASQFIPLKRRFASCWKAWAARTALQSCAARKGSIRTCTTVGRRLTAYNSNGVSILSSNPRSADNFRMASASMWQSRRVRIDLVLPKPACEPLYR